MTRQEVYDRVHITLNSYFKDPDDGFIGIDKGNEVLMIENFRSEGVWQVFMQNPFVQKGLERAKFSLAN